MSPETRGKLRLAHLGRKRSPEHREKIRQANHRPEVQEKIRQALLGRKASPESREKMRQAHLGNKNLLGHKHSPETIEKIRQGRLRRTMPKEMTSIECLLFAEFKKRRLKFEMHKTMFGRWQPDFVFESARLIVEADGDYWHSLPKAREREVAFAVAAGADGWSVWRFGEKEIRMHTAICAKAVAKFVRNH